MEKKVEGIQAWASSLDGKMDKILTRLDALDALPKIQTDICSITKTLSDQEGAITFAQIDIANLQNRMKRETQGSQSSALKA